MNLSDLRPAVYNPRDITPEALAKLSRCMETFGDLSGIVWNVGTGNLVTGHQRVQELKGLGAEFTDGCFNLGSDVFPVRVVDWERSKEILANIAANNPNLAGTYCIPKVKDIIVEIDDGQIDIELTGFSKQDLYAMFGESKNEDAPKINECPKCGHKW